MPVRYSIITPTLLRDTLSRLCESINNQSCTSWQHIIVVDTKNINQELLRGVSHPQRVIMYCDVAHRDYGDTCRRSAWDTASGEYLLYIDDDNYLIDNQVLETLQLATYPVVLFPLLYRGEKVLPEPIMMGRSDGNALMVRRDIGQWPVCKNITNKKADWILIEDITSNYEYEVLNDRALVVYEQENYGTKPRR